MAGGTSGIAVINGITIASTGATAVVAVLACFNLVASVYMGS